MLEWEKNNQNTSECKSHHQLLHYYLRGNEKAGEHSTRECDLLRIIKNNIICSFNDLIERRWSVYVCSLWVHWLNFLALTTLMAGNGEHRVMVTVSETGDWGNAALNYNNRINISQCSLSNTLVDFHNWVGNAVPAIVVPSNVSSLIFSLLVAMSHCAEQWPLL